MHSIKSIALAVLALLTPLSCLTGCGHKSNAGKLAGPLPINIIAVDRSGSTEKVRPDQLTVVNVAYRRAGKFSEKAAVYAVDSKSACVLTLAKVEANRDISPAVLKVLQTDKSHRSTDTRPAIFWEQMADLYAASPPDQAVRIIYLTDGDNDFPADEARIQAAIDRLSANQQVSVGIFGVTMDNNNKLQKQFQGFGSRATIVALNDKTAWLEGLNTLRLGATESSK